MNIWNYVKLNMIMVLEMNILIELDNEVIINSLGDSKLISKLLLQKIIFFIN